MEILFTLLALCVGNPPVTGWLPTQRASNAWLWWLVCFHRKQGFLQTMDRLANCDAVMLLWCHWIQATGLDAWASRVKCPAWFVSHLHEICIYIWVVYSLCFFCCLSITVTWWYVWCFEWASGNQAEVQACLVTLWLFIISCYSLYKTTLGLLCSWFENNPHFHK